jgi:hypothetical protein
MFNQIIYLIYVECNFYSCGRFAGYFIYLFFFPISLEAEQCWWLESGLVLAANGHLGFVESEK